MPDTDADGSLQADIVETLDVARDAERELIGRLPPKVRDVSGSPEAWSPKDHQAHLSAWKRRQLERFEAAARGALPQPASEPIDEVNAGFYRERAGWGWDEVQEDADQVHAALVDAVAKTPTDALLESELLLSGSVGNGAGHTLEHLRWLTGVHGRPDRVAELAEKVEAILRRRTVPARVIGAFIYNEACWYALAGQLDEARRRLPEAFRLRSDLADWALEDPDLAALRGELPQLRPDASVSGD